MTFCSLPSRGHARSAGPAQRERAIRKRDALARIAPLSPSKVARKVRIRNAHHPHRACPIATAMDHFAPRNRLLLAGPASAIGERTSRATDRDHCFRIEKLRRVIAPKATAYTPRPATFQREDRLLLWADAPKEASGARFIFGTCEIPSFTLENSPMNISFSSESVISSQE